MSLRFLHHFFETSPVIWERSPKPKSNLPSPAFERHAWWVWFIVYLAVSADATTSSGNHSLDPSFERPSHFPSGFPCTLMMSRHSPCFRVRSVLLPLQSRWTFTWWMASRGPTSWRTHKNKVISQHLWVEQTVKSFFFWHKQTVFWCGDLLWISFWLPVPSSPVPSAPSSPPPAVFSPSCPVSARPHPFIEGESLVSSQVTRDIDCNVKMNRLVAADWR